MMAHRMAATTTDVRQWLREQGEDPGTRGPVPQALKEKYDAAHPIVPGVVLGSEYHDNAEPETPADSVTAAGDPPSSGAAASVGEDPGSGAGSGGRHSERRPKKVGPPRKKPWTARLFGGGGDRAKNRARGKHQRESLGDFAEEMWTDLAWMTEPLPPLSKILTVQAPYAGVVFDEQVAGTPLDAMLQPAAKYSGVFRALNGLAGPPVYVGLICATGKRIQPVDPDTGQPARYPDGSPVMVYDRRTQMLFQGLRYSLLQMTKISEVKAEELHERTEAAAARMKVVDKIIDDLFAIPAPPAPRPPSEDPRPAGDQPPPGPDETRSYLYPVPPAMDTTGADPGRMG